MKLSKCQAKEFTHVYNFCSGGPCSSVVFLVEHNGGFVSAIDFDLVGLCWLLRLITVGKCDCWL